MFKEKALLMNVCSKPTVWDGDSFHLGLPYNSQQLHWFRAHWVGWWRCINFPLSLFPPLLSKPTVWDGDHVYMNM